jgi:tRNA-modifying protein YgfZ
MVSDAAYRAARHRAASIDRSDRGRILVTGTDRASYLQGLLTNDIAALREGTGCYAAYLTPQGRMISDLYLYELGDAILIALPRHAKDAVLTKLDRLIFTEDASVRDVTDAFSEVAMVGPAAADAAGAIIGNAASAQIRALAEHGNVRVDFDGSPAIVTRITDTGAQGFEIYVERAKAEDLRSRLDAAGVVPVDAETAETLRIEAGVPVFGRDMNEETIPLEAGIEGRAVSFTKGCYVGQEVIVRVLHRGHGRVARKLVGLTIDGNRVPSAGAPVRAGDREAGQVTSSALSPALDKPIALAYVHRDFVEPGTLVSVDGARAAVTGLPFVR